MKKYSDTAEFHSFSGAGKFQKPVNFHFRIRNTGKWHHNSGNTIIFADMNLIFQIMNNKFLLQTILMLSSVFALQAVELTGSLSTHDPSRIIKDGSKYYFFSTGNGIVVSSSDNLSSWKTKSNPVFPAGTWPDWIDAAVPDFGGHFWAPDIIYMNGAYYLYYSCSSWGSSRSAIGVARSNSLNSPEWTDLGMVVSSDGSSTAINAIDPGLFKDDDGKVYMVYGSYFGGIGIVEIDTVGGLATTTVKRIYGGNHQAMEAANLIKEGNTYYLIVNRGTCCDGINSTYYITVGRSDTIVGPFELFRTILSNRRQGISDRVISVRFMTAV